MKPSPPPPKSPWPRGSTASNFQVTAPASGPPAYFATKNPPPTPCPPNSPPRQMILCRGWAFSPASKRSERSSPFHPEGSRGPHFPFPPVASLEGQGLCLEKRYPKQIKQLKISIDK